MNTFNAYQDNNMANAYSQLEFPGTYFLAYRDIPKILKKHVKGRKALDFGCGAGRSTRFLQRQGFQALGVDIASNMIKRANEIDPAGDYRLVEDGDLGHFEANSFDVILSAFTFDNIPLVETKIEILSKMNRLLKTHGKVINLVSSPQIYLHEWASFTTRDFLEQNLKADSGDIVKITNTAINDGRPVEDVVWKDEDYREIYAQTGFAVEAMYEPLALETEPFEWVNETKIAPWVIYVLKRV
jgi:ubiquinone/menaquinone biosynthesis C-methylase UbiE